MQENRAGAHPDPFTEGNTMKAKRITSWLLAVLLLLSLSVTAFAADTYIHGYFRYTVDDQSVTITAYTGREETVTVPAMIGGDPVNTIAAGAFADNVYAKTIYLPDTIMTVEEGAFSADQKAVFGGETPQPGSGQNPPPGQQPAEGAGGASGGGTPGGGTPGGGRSGGGVSGGSSGGGGAEGITVGGGASTIPSDTAENSFSDVGRNDYYYEAVLWAVKNGITQGTDATHFSPNAPCTRGQIVTFLWRAAGRPEPVSDSMPFTDVVRGSYYEKAVLWAVENGITNGVDETHFAPDATVNRAQTVTFLYRAVGEKTQGENTFGDIKTGAYYYDAVIWASERGITKGTGEGVFSPEADCLRGQIVTFLYRAYA